MQLFPILQSAAAGTLAVKKVDDDTLVAGSGVEGGAAAYFDDDNLTTFALPKHRYRLFYQPNEHIHNTIAATLRLFSPLLLPTTPSYPSPVKAKLVFSKSRHTTNSINVFCLTKNFLF